MLWPDCLNRLKLDIKESNVASWLLPLHAKEEEGTLYLLAPNEIVCGIVNENYHKIIQKHIHDITGDLEHKVTILVGTQVEQKASSLQKAGTKKISETIYQPNIDSNSMKKRTFINYLNKKMSFGNYVEGKSNQLALAASWHVADNIDNDYNPLYIYGGVGLGKTHLMHAIGNQLRLQDPEASVIYLHSEAFVNDMISALRTNSMDKFKEHYRSVDALLIDDIQFFVNKERSQEEFFHTFNILLELNKHIVLTSDTLPRDVKGLTDRLRSRISKGLSVELQPPDLETRVAILRKKSEEAGLHLSNDVAFFIGQRFNTNIRELEGALVKLIATVKLTKTSNITMDVVKHALQDQLISLNSKISIDLIKKAVADFFNIRIADLDSKSRKRALVRPRQLAMVLCKELTQSSLPEIGRNLGNRDHATVIHGNKKMTKLIKEEKNMEEAYRIIKRSLTN
ncbi:MAG: chromosomal replication initiator protein DnaA [Thiotrichaceae bacterium]|nr:chromosomal replication initiator protein DnaA [Thiotrichaceae bacterium]